MNRSLENKQVLVVGLAKSGVAAAKLALARGARVVCVDQKPLEGLSVEARALAAQGAIICPGAQPRERFEEADLVVVSPGVPMSNPGVETARRAGIEVIGEVELAWRELAAHPRFIGITGTNGKSTTTALAGFLCESAGLRTFAGGNLGRPLSEAAMDPLPWDVIVCELSSYQLEGIVTLRPDAAVLTNVTPDHIDRYESHDAYGLAKRRIFMNQTARDAAIVNAVDPVTLALVEGTCARRLVFGGEAATFSHGVITVTLDQGAETYLLRAPALRGSHNAQNAMAALLAVRAIGVPSGSLQGGLDHFQGLAHRLESVGIIDGVEYINDSKATNIDSTLVALQAFPRNVWLIAGGRGKGASYRPMIESSRGRLKGVLTIGEDALLIERAFHGEAIECVSCVDLSRAVGEARRRAAPGDLVLLSPACASYDQFNNFEERGDAFRRLVTSLSRQEAG